MNTIRILLIGMGAILLYLGAIHLLSASFSKEKKRRHFALVCLSAAGYDLTGAYVSARGFGLAEAPWFGARTGLFLLAAFFLFLAHDWRGRSEPSRARGLPPVIMGLFVAVLLIQAGAGFGVAPPLGLTEVALTGLALWLSHARFGPPVTARAPDDARKSEAEVFTRLLNGSGVGAAVLDGQGRLSRVNPALSGLTGLPETALVGRSCLDLFHPEDREPAGRGLGAVIAGEIPSARMERRFLRGDGSILWVDLRTSAVSLCPDGKPEALFCLMVDISDRMAATEELGRLEIQLFETQKLETVRTLAGGAAHDFNNILQVISGYIHYIRRKKVTFPDLDDHLKRMNEAVARAAELIGRLMAFSRRVDPQRTRLDLNEHLLAVVQLLEHAVPRTIRIETRTSPDIGLIQGNANQIEQVLMNLGTNARDAMPEGGQILLETENVTLTDQAPPRPPGVPPGGYVRLRVSDTGTGMNEEVCRRMFEPFFTTKGEGKGTGLGLSTVLGIVRAHDGFIRCESLPGRGSVFDVYWPVVDGLREARAVDDEPAADLPPGSGAILWVDDDPSLREIGKTVLESYGYRVFATGLPLEAMEIVRDETRPLDLVVLAPDLPETGGLNCLKAIKSRRPGLKVLAAAGGTWLDREEELLRAGALDVIRKPSQMRSIVEKIQRTLAMKPVA